MALSLRSVSLCLAFLLVACANGRVDDPSPVGVDEPGDDAHHPAGNPDAGPGASDAAMPDGGPGAADSGPGNDILDGSSPPVSACLTECPDQACGAFPDGCGAFLTCGECADGEICGLLEANLCAAPASSCSAKSADEVCTGKCGATSDGCSSVIQCNANNGGVTCSSDQICGGYPGALQPNACVDKPTCVPQTCESKGVECGPEGDGCSGLLDCTAEHGCTGGQICGTGAMTGLCVDPGPSQCTRLTVEEACANTCGQVPDDCGELLDCPACPDGESCGGGGPGQCGIDACDLLDEATVCAGKCGSQSDGCDGAYVCDDSNGGETCDASAGESCGGGGTASVCGKPPCTPKTQEEACPGSGGHPSCGQASIGCGLMIDCGSCANGEICGLNTPSICGAVPSCTPVGESSACAGKCGVVPNGCGGSYTCTAGNGGVNCSGAQYCGATTPNQCGAPVVTCTSKTCAQLGHTCGLASDSCGNIINCWPGCSASNQSCAGSCSSVASCLADDDDGVQSCVAAEGSCMGSLCDNLPTGCATSSPTRLTGTVRTPGRLVNGAWINRLPVPNAIVYIPSNPSTALPTIFEGVAANTAASCGRCADEKLIADGETLLVAAVTNFKGEFTLQGNIPVGSAFNLVVKVGKWRRVVQVASGVSQSCETRPLSADLTLLSASTSDGLTGTHLPKIAVSTGDVDAMECVLRGMGIADSEFTVRTGSGRIHMYRANGAGMRTCNGTYKSGGQTKSCAATDNYGCLQNKTGCSFATTTVADTTLFASQAALNAYDMVVLDCEGGTSPANRTARTLTERSRLLSYVDNGGRAFASHWSYEWLDGNGTMESAAVSWASSDSYPGSGTGFVSLPSGPTQRAGANPVKSLLYRDWLDWQGALTSTTAGQLTSPTTPQLTITDPRDVAGASVGSSTDEWMYRTSSGAKVQQLSFNTPYGSSEAAICGRVAFSAFHVAASSGGTTLKTGAQYFPAQCNSTAPLTPQEKTLAFMLFDLGSCVSAGDPPAPPACAPKTTAQVCPSVNSACGYVSDGCGGVVDCAGCDSGYYCDGNTCRPQECTPSTCSSLGYNCGSPADGCGGIARDAQGHEGCGTCSAGQTCGLGGPGLCGSSGCLPIDQAVACPSNWCGLVSDGCGGTLNCGACSSGVCGGGGQNQCGPNSCTVIPYATACAGAGKNCGLVSNGCGGTHDCGICTAPKSCGGGGTANVCGQPSCTPFTQTQACSGLECGWASNGCGGAISCGTCPNGGVCGGDGANQCGAECDPRSCSEAGAQCGAISDHCGGITQCGVCPTGKTCGAGGPNKCGSTTCTRSTCAAANAECGLIGDGCGGVLDCGTCDAPETCGGAGAANQCGVGHGGCNPLSCQDQGVQCGAASDGCGGLLDCGGCAPGGYCELGVCAYIQ
jgi:hypothetical protein